jgi:hypothetical protein
VDQLQLTNENLKHLDKGKGPRYVEVANKGQEIRMERAGNQPPSTKNRPQQRDHDPYIQNIKSYQKIQKEISTDSY